MNFMENRLTIYLTAYRKKNSTETTLIRLVEDWKTSLEGREIIGILSTDMSKAFDSMYPNLLLEKLKHYGFSTDALRLVESYFEDRQNRVKLGETKSEWKVTCRGCPQGSSFGPLLRNIFQNDPVHKVEFCKISMYADDHQLYCSERDPQLVERHLNHDIKTATQWYSQNHLLAIKEKYQAMVINPPKATDSKITVKADEEGIEIKKQLKLLGVIIDDQMNFGEHIREISRKASQRLGGLNQFRNIISTASKLTIYKTSIMPYVTYCSTVWHFAKSSDLRKVERIQEKAMKIIYCDKSKTHELVPEYISKLFEMPNQHYALRNNDFVIPRYRTVMKGLPLTEEQLAEVAVESGVLDVPGDYFPVKIDFDTKYRREAKSAALRATLKEKMPTKTDASILQPLDESLISVINEQVAGGVTEEDASEESSSHGSSASEDNFSISSASSDEANSPKYKLRVRLLSESDSNSDW
eukprot:gene1607-1778_t